MFKIIKRDGTEVDFVISKIVNAISKANEEVSSEKQISIETISNIAKDIEKECETSQYTLNVEDIQDKVEYLLMQYEEYKPRENQITIGQLFKVMIGYNRKSLIRFAIITVAIWLVGFLAIFFGYNGIKAQYQTDWTYNISTFDGTTYMDGSQFYYPDLISIENLKLVKDSDPEFKDLLKFAKAIRLQIEKPT